MWIKRFLVGFLLFLTVFPALATPRSFPPDVKRATMRSSIFPQVLIDGNIRRLSPGAKIIGKQNTIIMHASLMNNVFIVNYTVDAQGYINRVWILTDEEQAQSIQ